MVKTILLGGWFKMFAVIEHLELFQTSRNKLLVPCSHVYT